MKLSYLYKAIEARYQNIMSNHFELTLYGHRLRKYKSMYSGKRCFIVANGPSLCADDLDKIHSNGDISFAMNRIYKIFGETKWRPTYYVCEDIKIFNESVDRINAVPACAKFVPVNLKWYDNISIDGAEYFFANYGTRRKWKNNISTRIDNSMDSMGTVTFTCINIAIYMGISAIYLLGVDHNYQVIINEDGETIVDNNAKDYFCDDYDNDIKDTVIHDMGQNTRAYRNANRFCEENGIKIYNATRGGKLEVFQRVDFDKLFV